MHTKLNYMMRRSEELIVAMACWKAEFRVTLEAMMAEFRTVRSEIGMLSDGLGDMASTTFALRDLLLHLERDMERLRLQVARLRSDVTTRATVP